MHCQLLIPDLFWPERERRDIYASLAVPALEQLLAKGRRHRAQPASAESWLCQRFGVERQHDWPVAPYSLLADGGAPGTHYWLRADPVHLSLESGHMVLADSVRFALSRNEADELARSLNAHFAADGLNFLPLRPSRWYLRADGALGLATTELAAAVGRSIDALLPTGSDAQAWRARLNEVQMLLHGHPVNEARESAGQLPINSLWLWGGGSLSEEPAAPSVAAPLHAVFSDHPLALGLAQAAQIGVRKMPRSAAAMLDASEGEGVCLMMLEYLRGSAQYDDAQTWREALLQLEGDWFVPLLSALKQGRIGMLSLHALGPEGMLCTEITRADLRRFWRRAKPLSAYA